MPDKMESLGGVRGDRGCLTGVFGEGAACTGPTIGDGAGEAETSDSSVAEVFIAKLFTRTLSVGDKRFLKAEALLECWLYHLSIVKLC